MIMDNLLALTKMYNPSLSSQELQSSHKGKPATYNKT